MNQKENDAFGAFLREKVAEADRSIGYQAPQLLRMVDAKGGYATAISLISERNPSPGFSTLWEGKRLDLSVEALVLEHKWIVFFDEELLRIAERKLLGADYSPTRYRTDPTRESTTNGDARALKAPRNSVSFSAHCKKLGMPLSNPMNSWCASSLERGQAVFTIWEDRIKEGRYVFWENAQSPADTRAGSRELKRILDQAIERNFEVYGIWCRAKDVSSATRKRGFFNEEELLILRLSVEEPGIVAYIEGQLPTVDFLTGRRLKQPHFLSAADDLDDVPPGIEKPERRWGTSSGYRRDPKVRQHVLDRAKGHCEYCLKPGFPLPDGRLYLETHHIIGLAKHGPDTVRNVIALCPHHHREAHFGRNAESLAAEFLERLSTQPQ